MINSIRLTAIFIFLFSSLSIFAQNTQPTQSVKDSSKTNKTESSKMKTLFSDTKTMKLKSWGVSMSAISQFGQLGPQAGMNVAFQANNKWSIGITHLQNVRKRGDDNKGYCNCVIMDKPETAFTAFSIEYTAKANSILHVSFPLLIGTIRTRRENIMAQPAYSSATYLPYPNGHDNDFDRNDRNAFGGPKSLGIQAGVNLELNVYKYIKVFSGINYRIAAGKNSTEEMSGLSGNLGLKLGLFDQKFKKK